MEKNVFGKNQAYFPRSISHPTKCFDLAKPENPFSIKFRLAKKINQKEQSPIFQNSRKTISQKPNAYLKTENDFEILLQFKNERRRILSGTGNVKVGIHKDILQATKVVIKSISWKDYSKNEYLAGKREIFLLQMKINEKKEQMDLVKKESSEKEGQLELFEAKIKEHVCFFNNFLDDDKHITKEQTRQSENIIREKLQVVSKLKELVQQKINKISTNARFFERLTTLFSYKEFLDPMIEISEFEIKNKRKMSNGIDTIVGKQREKARDTVNLKVPISSENSSKENHSVLSRNSNRKSLGSLFKESIQETISNKRASLKKNGNSFIRTVMNATKNKRDSLKRESTIQGDSLLNPRKLSATKLRSSSQEATQPDDLLSKKFLVQMYAPFDETMLNFVTGETPSAARILEDSFKLSDIYTKIEEQNLELILLTQNCKNEIAEKREKLEKAKKNQQAKILTSQKSRKDLAVHIENISSQIISKTQGSKSLRNFVFQQIDLINSKLKSLNEILEVSSKGDFFEDLLDIEKKLMGLVSKLQSTDKSVVSKFEKMISDEKKMRSVREQHLKDAKLFGEKNKEVTGQKILVFRVRTVNSKSFSKIKPKSAFLNDPLKIENMENEKYFN